MDTCSATITHDRKDQIEGTQLDIIHTLNEYLSRLGLSKLSVELNTLGCKECRPKYHEALKEFFNSSWS